jgi:hypothetical protein
MKLIKRHIKMNPDTLQPEMEITLSFPMEVAMDALCRTEEEYQAKLGKELVELLRTKD